MANQLLLQNIGKRFNRHWIFRCVNYEFELGKTYAITGPNGSGKSTLLQVIAGALQHSEGQIGWCKMELKNSAPIIKKQQKQSNQLEVVSGADVSIAAPYLELIEELTLQEFFEFHFQFKQIWKGYSIASIIHTIQLADAANKQIRYFSSGMKQRVKLAQAFFSNTPLLLLDEPTTNLDATGIALYLQLIHQFCDNRITIICSNEEKEIAFCNYTLHIANFKKINT